MTEWRQLTIGDVAVGVFDGPHATPSPATEGPIYLGIKNITDAGLLDLSDVRHISEEEFEHWTRRVAPKAGDVVFTYEATLHRYALIPDGFRGCLGRRIALIRPDVSVVRPRFLHFLMLGPAWRATVTERVISGATVDRVPLIGFESFPISVPDLATQDAVLSVLGAIDDLIENNRRRVKLLEETARSIYREWFIRFRFPGSEDVSYIDSSLGPIPHGWEVSTLGEAGKWISGGTPRTSVEEYWGGNIPWITSGTLTSLLLDRSERMVTEYGASNGTKVVDRDTLLFVVRGMSLVREFRVGIADVSLAFGQDCKALIANASFEPLFLGFEVICRADEIQGMVELAGHGTGKLSTDRLKALQIPLPPLAAQRRFASVVQPLRETMTTLRLSTDRLVAIRDSLLPKLVTGQIDVSNLDPDVVLAGAGV